LKRKTTTRQKKKQKDANLKKKNYGGRDRPTEDRPKVEGTRHYSRKEMANLKGAGGRERAFV